MRARQQARGGFTLAEVAVTIVIVGIGLVLVLQGLNNAKTTAAHTRNSKLARELALYTLGQVESGLYQDDIKLGLQGNYSDQGYAAFVYDVVVGDEAFVESDPNGGFDSWKPRTQKELDLQKQKEEEDLPEPYEKVKIRITFPKYAEYPNELVLERWIPWKQVYGDTEADSSSSKTAGTTSGTTAK
ncbi:MAG: prepilin-type N-terminal cleavage/methylation domain-containing protein [Planctomycetes bacterium]|nr:prepilin-type N-terminal cleavage/methylation domain-containing protein [Planctomycetota bacterium]